MGGGPLLPDGPYIGSLQCFKRSHSCRAQFGGHSASCQCGTRYVFAYPVSDGVCQEGEVTSMMGNLKFELGRRLDSGGRGDVYLGYVRGANLTVALKYFRDFHVPQQ